MTLALVLAIVSAVMFLGSLIWLVVLVVKAPVLPDEEHTPPAGSLQAHADELRGLEDALDGVDMRARPRIRRKPGGGWAS